MAKEKNLEECCGRNLIFENTNANEKYRAYQPQRATCKICNTLYERDKKIKEVYKWDKNHLVCKQGHIMLTAHVVHKIIKNHKVQAIPFREPIPFCPYCNEKMPETKGRPICL